MPDMRPKPFVFVLMPFTDDFRDVYDLGIKPACEEAGAFCQRLDEQIFQESMLQRIYHQIDKADLIVADMSTRNPNVFYEVGYAHALGKTVVLLTQDSNDIPFDLKHFHHIDYGGSIVDLKRELNRRVVWCIANPQGSEKPAEFALRLLVSDIELKEGESVNISASWSTTAEYGIADRQMAQTALEIVLTLFNPSNLSHDRFFDIGLIAPDRFDQNSSGFRTARMKGGRYIHISSFTKTVLPESWEMLNFTLPGEGIELGERIPGLKEKMQFRVIDVHKVHDYPFLLNVPDKETKKKEKRRRLR